MNAMNTDSEKMYLRPFHVMLSMSQLKVIIFNDLVYN